MYRRRYLTLAGIGGVVSLAGCLNQIERAIYPQTPAGMTVETATWSTSFVVNPNREWPYAVVVSTREEAATNIEYRETEFDLHPRTFVDQTDFEQSYLILIEYVGNTSANDSLELKRIERRDEGLHVKAKVYHPRTRVNNVSIHSLFIRVTDDREDTPENITVDVDN